MDRYWLLSNTCYGTWLPGSGRGFVGHVREHREGDADSSHAQHAGTACDEDMPGLERAARMAMHGPPIQLTTEHAKAFFNQLQETAGVRGWELRAVAIMDNHFHIVVGVPRGPTPFQGPRRFQELGNSDTQQSLR